MKKLLIIIVASLFMVGLTGCDMFGPDDIPEVCEDGFELQGTECVPISDEGDAPVISLAGNASVSITQGETYTDAGATATDTEDGDLTADIVVNNPVDTSTPGTYTITYNVTDSDDNAATQVTRTVTVTVGASDNDPVITLVGSASITINAGDTYNDQGATATDVEDGNLTSDIMVTNNVDASVSGTYTVVYNVTDSDGNSVSITRTVMVLPSDAEVLANYIVDNWDGSLQFLGLTMANMDFSTAMNMSFEVDFEITEDVDDVHTVNAVVTDQYLYAETGDTMHRQIDLDVDGEMQLTLNLIVEEVETGVHVYIEYRPILDLLQAEDPEMVNMFGWVGLDDQWALFQLDDTLQNVVEVEVVKNMIVSLFFSEMGEMFFYDVQEQIIEDAIGFDLNQYNVDLGAFVDLLIEEDFTAAETMLNSIQVEHIILHLDHMYIAWHLYELFMEFETELGTAGFDTTKLSKLDTATYNATTEQMEVNLPVDPLEGSQAFFESLTETELDTLVEVAIKPTIEMMVYGQFMQDVNPGWLQGDFEAMLGEYQTFLEEHWPESSDPFVYADELAELQANGAVTYWNDLTEDEQNMFFWAIDENRLGWSVWQLEEYERQMGQFQPMLHWYGSEWDIDSIEQNINDMITNNATYISNTYDGFDVNPWLLDIENDGLVWWYSSLPETEQTILNDVANMSGNEAYLQPLMDLMYLAQDPGRYQYFYGNEFGELGVDQATSTIENILLNNRYVIENDYGYDVDALVAELYDYPHKAIEWYTTDATVDEQNMLRNLAEDSWEEHYMWTIDMLDMILEYPGDFYVYYGRQTEMYDFYHLNMEVTYLIWENEVYLSTEYSIDAQTWVDDLNMMDVVYWYDSLTQTEKDALDEISMMGDGWYRWTVELLQMRENTPEEFSVDLCNWDWCLREMDITDNLVALVNAHSATLVDEGYNVTDLVNEIEMYGATEWYAHYTNEQDRELLRQIAEEEEWQYRIIDTIQHIKYAEEDLMNFLTTHETSLNALVGIDATQMIADLDMYGIQVFVADYISEAEIEILADEYVYPKIEGLFDAIDTGEVPEYLLATLFADPHVDAALGSLTPTEDFDPFDVLDIASLEANLLAIDFDALALETVDLELLLTAIYEGPIAYETFMTGLETTAPNSELILSLFAPAVEELQPYMIYVDDFNYAMDGLSVFEHYFDPTYWLDDSGMELDMIVTDELYVETTMTMDSIMYQLVVSDFFDDVNTYLTGFETLPFPWDSNWECIDPLDMECEDLEIDNLMAALTQFGDIMVHATFDPSDPSWMEYEIDATDFLDALVKEANSDVLDDPDFVPDNMYDIWTGVTNATVTITMSEGGTITMPAEADVDNANDIAYEFGKFGVAMFARDYLRDLMWEYEWNTSALDDLIAAGDATYSVNDFWFIRTSAAFDNDMSTIDVTVDTVNNTAEFELMLYWIDGTEALSGPVSLADFDALFTEFNELQNQAAYDTMKGFVNDTNYNMTKLWLMFLMQNNDHYKDEQEFN